jgi:dienelactone hydrolase
MNASRATNLLAFLLWTWAGHLALSVEPRPQVQTHTVSHTYNARPFSYQLELVEQTDTHRLYRIRYPSPITTAVTENNTVPGDYYLPLGETRSLRRPAVVCLHILNGNFELERITCCTLAAHGIPALMIKLPYYGERSPTGSRRRLLGDPQVFLAALPQGLEDVRRAVDLLASREEVNPKAVGILGISLGGIVAATAAAQEPRIARAALILAGGDLDRIIHHARETRDLSQLIRNLAPAERAQLEAALAKVDPLNAAARLRARAEQDRVLMINAANDEVIPADCTRRLAAALGITDRVQWLAGLGHYTALAALPNVLATAVEFFAQDLPAEARQRRAAPPAGPLQAVMHLLAQAALFVGNDPAAGHGHLADLEADVTPAGGKPFTVRLRLVRGWAGRFRIEVDAPTIGHVALGTSDYPWMLAAGNTVFKGTPAAAGPIDPLAHANPQHVLKLRVLGGALGAAGMSPQVLTSLVTVADDSTPAEQAVRVETKTARRDSARLVFKSDRTPARLSVTARGVQVEVRFRQWQPNTVIPAELFAEPAGARCQDVDQADLVRMFSAMFNLLMDSL